MNTNTINIDSRMKELYYYKQPSLKETTKSVEHQYQFWNYMAGISVQNITFHSKKVSRPI